MAEKDTSNRGFGLWMTTSSLKSLGRVVVRRTRRGQRMNSAPTRHAR